MLPEDKGIEETVCVGQKLNAGGDERAVLFVKMKGGARFTPQLRADIVKTVESKLSRRHVPAIIMEVPEIVRVSVFILTSAPTLTICCGWTNGSP
jgi:acyl-coenzyme A synthetase/AMP-(fatty) acid ligase